MSKVVLPSFFSDKLNLKATQKTTVQPNSANSATASWTVDRKTDVLTLMYSTSPGPGSTIYEASLTINGEKSQAADVTANIFYTQYGTAYAAIHSMNPGDSLTVFYHVFSDAEISVSAAIYACE